MSDDDRVMFVADWGEAHIGGCDCCGQEHAVLTFNVDADGTVVDLCRPCALGLAADA